MTEPVPVRTGAMRTLGELAVLAMFGAEHGKPLPDSAIVADDAMNALADVIELPDDHWVAVWTPPMAPIPLPLWAPVPTRTEAELIRDHESDRITQTLGRRPTLAVMRVRDLAAIELPSQDTEAAG